MSMKFRPDGTIEVTAQGSTLERRERIATAVFAQTVIDADVGQLSDVAAFAVLSADALINALDAREDEERRPSAPPV